MMCGGVVGYREDGEIICCQCGHPARNGEADIEGITDDERDWEMMECAECGRTLEEAL